MSAPMTDATTTAAANGAIHLDPSKRHDIVLLFDVTDGNPNGDPDAGNLPRVDPETMQGLVTDVAIKRKIRDWVDATRGTEERFKIYIQSNDALNTLHQRAYTEEGLKLAPKGKPQPRGDVEKAQGWMLRNFYDVRTFGAVMSTGVNAGQVRGPVQFTFARSVDPIVPLDLSITRIAITRPEDMGTVATESGEAGDTGGKRTEMGRKALVPYGLYKAHGFVVAPFAKRTGFDATDLGILWESLERMWDLDRSASRGLTACRGLYVYSHENALGNASSAELFGRITVKANDGVVAPRAFSDYTVSVQDGGLPEGVTLTRLVE